jgi:hypothetical protein
VKISVFSQFLASGAHMRTLAHASIVPEEREASIDIEKHIVQLSVSISLEIVMLGSSLFPSNTGPNFTFAILMLGVAVSWTSTVYDTSTLALACPLV